MTIKRLRFVSREGAEDATPDMCLAVISISDPGSMPVRLRDGWFDVLVLQFHDLDLCRDVNATLRAALLRLYQPMTAAQAADVVRFVERMVAAGVEGFLVHCEAGISRSAAVAKWIADRYHLPSPGSAAKRHNRYVYNSLREAACRDSAKSS